jgi:hypothetical protein
MELNIKKLWTGALLKFILANTTESLILKNLWIGALSKSVYQECGILGGSSKKSAHQEPYILVGHYLSSIHKFRNTDIISLVL